MKMHEMDFDSWIRKVKDFPKAGITFYDITSVFASPKALSSLKKVLVERYQNRQIDRIIAVDSRGFLIAPLLAESIGLPIALARKKGKLPNACFSRSYKLEYGEDTIEIQKLDIHPGEKVLIVDDLVATGGTLKAICDLLEEQKVIVEEIFTLIDLPFLNYSKLIPDKAIFSLMTYHQE